MHTPRRTLVITASSLPISALHRVRTSSSHERRNLMPKSPALRLWMRLLGAVALVFTLTVGDLPEA